MNLQDIRRYYEYPVIDCCNLQRVEYRAENTLEPGGDAIHKFCLARLQFGEMAEQTIACGLLSNKRAVFVVEYYGPKGIGPADAQDFMECVICSFHELKGVTSISGPDFAAMDDRPYFFARVSFGLQIPANIGPPRCLEYFASAVTCDCIDSLDPFYVCGDILDAMGVSICDYDDPSTFPPNNSTVPYDNANVLNPGDLGLTLEQVAENSKCRLN